MMGRNLVWQTSQSGIVFCLVSVMAACGGSSGRGGDADPDALVPADQSVSAPDQPVVEQPEIDQPDIVEPVDGEPADDDPAIETPPAVELPPVETDPPAALDVTELELMGSFSTRGGIGLAFDRFTDTIWTFGGTTLRQYDLEGNLLVTLNPEIGESADDADLDFADADFSLAGVDIQAGTLLFTNGERTEAEVYAIGSDGTVLSILETDFGNSHVVGSAYGVQRGTFFMLQDRVPADELDNLVGEVDANTGEVLNQFDLDELDNPFGIFFGDLEVNNETGNLWIVSTSQSEILRLTPDGEELPRLIVPEGAEGSLAASGIAIDEGRKQVYVQNNSGLVFRYAYTD